MSQGRPKTPGDTAQSDWAVTPTSPGTSALADISVRTIDPEGTIVTLTGVTEPTADNYQIIWTIPSTAIPGDWTLRWESNLPSVVAVEEVKFRVYPTPFGANA